MSQFKPGDVVINENCTKTARREKRLSGCDIDINHAGRKNLTHDWEIERNSYYLLDLVKEATDYGGSEVWNCIMNDAEIVTVSGMEYCIPEHHYDMQVLEGKYDELVFQFPGRETMEWRAQKRQDYKEEYDAFMIEVRNLQKELATEYKRLGIDRSSPKWLYRKVRKEILDLMEKEEI